MDLGTHLDGEDVIRSASASRGGVGGSTGTLACTETSLVYVADGTVTDISRSMICATRYGRRSADGTSLLFGALAVVLGVAAFGFGAAADGGFLLLFGVVAVGFGVVVLALALLFRRATLVVQLPNTSYTFSSKTSDLEAISIAVRDREA